MERRRFLKVIAALPFAPVALKRAAWADEWEDFEREARPAPLPPAGMLGVVMGEPTTLSIVVPPGRLVKITGSALLPDGGSLMIKEQKTALAYYESSHGGVLEADVVVAPTAGAHTYRLEFTGPVADSPSFRPTMIVRDLGAAAGRALTADEAPWHSA